MLLRHIEDDQLDQYALGVLAGTDVADLEEHLLLCAECQSRLAAVDDFVKLFRSAAAQSDVRPRRKDSILRRPVVLWPAVAAMAAGLSLLVVNQRDFSGSTPTVYLQALRGPESAAQVAAGKPVEVVFDFEASGNADGYQAQVVDSLGHEIVQLAPYTRDGKLAVRVKGLRSGSYWVRLYRKGAGELLSEYALQSN